MVIKLVDIYKLLLEGTDIEKAKEALKQKDAYSGEEVVELLEEIVKQQKDSNEQIANIGQFFAYLGQEIVPTEEIVNSYHFWLGKAFTEYNMHNLAKHIEDLYEKEISKQPREKRQELLAKAIYETHPIKDSDAAREVSHRIAREYLIQERIRRMLTFNYAAGKEFLEKELEGKDMDKIEEEIRQNVRKLGIKIPQTYEEGRILREKAEYFEKQGKLEQAADLYYAIQQSKAASALYCPPYPFFYFCERHKRLDPRLLEHFNQKLKQIIQLKPDIQSTYELLEVYKHREEAYDLLGMKSEAEKDREARQKILEQI